MPLIVGTSGWQYRHWRPDLYPPGVAQRRWLEHYAERFAAVELNNSFYRLPPRATFESWRRRTPPDFVVAPKMSRYLTHVRRLRDPADPVRRFVGAARGLGSKLGPVLLQLPPNLPADLERLDETLAALGPSIRVAVEPRHPTWFTDDVYVLLDRHGAALCLTDRAGRRGPTERTAAWTYLRLHEGTASPVPGYGDRALGGWLDRLADKWSRADDVFVFFNNDAKACAVHNAVRFAELARRAGLDATRTSL